VKTDFSFEVYVQAKLRLLFPEGRMFAFVDSQLNHYKFWQIFQEDERHVVTRWGRIGKKPQTSVQSVWDPKRFIEQKIKEKLKKGYVEV